MAECRFGWYYWPAWIKRAYRCCSSANWLRSALANGVRVSNGLSYFFLYCVGLLSIKTPMQCVYIL